MTIAHHPSDMTLAAFAAATLDPARSLVVATHLSFCAACRNAVRAFEQVGGALLEDIEPTAMRTEAWRRVLERISAPEIERPVEQASHCADVGGLPAPLAQHELGPWRWIGRGLHWRSVAVPDTQDIRVFMMKAEPGIHLPHHRHTGIEWTCVLEGAFRHDFGRYGPGDFDEADDTVEHRPVVEEGVPCICLVALQGNIELQGWLGRLLQPLVRIRAP